MSILISGSVAFDTIIQTVGDFRAQDTIENQHLHLSLFSPVIRKEYGGTAANIAYSLALLGINPHIIASVWEDAADYLFRLKELGIGIELINIVPGSYCPQAYILRDEGSGQINTFHPGAMSVSGEISHGNIPFQFAIVSPDSKEGMIRRIHECKRAGIFTIFDPGQAMGIFSAQELKEQVVKADITIMNEPERVQFQKMVGEDFVDICRWFWHIAIETLGENGVQIFDGQIRTEILAIHVDTILDATGCGDVFRSGLLYGLSEWWTLQKSAELGNILGGIKIGYMGGQNHTFTREQIDTIGEKEYGVKFFA